MAAVQPAQRHRATIQGLRGERLVGLFLLGWFALNPPILGLFGAATTVFGLPLLYRYLFAVWAGIIVLAALAIRGGEDTGATGAAEEAPARPETELDR
ncbi:MAG: hypothetical protein IT562_14015 [Alphaproteobacteria bacterium]|nr:hypothetical protein [Alphaproteobacteria bacterium]